jgi:diacylglycerol kinase (ATP)
MKANNFRALIVINESAGNGRAGRLWEGIRTDILKRVPGHAIEIAYSSAQDPGERLMEFLETGHINCLITAGGDGSMNHLLNFLFTLKSNHLDNLTIGGIGLGSSNDFIKPCKIRIRKVPVRLDFENYTKNDVGVLKFQDDNDKWHTRYFLINASIGVTAEANLLFNEGDWMLNFLKRQYPAVAICYAAIKTILRYKNTWVDLLYQGQKAPLSLSNLAVNKNNYVSGGLHYDQNLKPDDGYLGLN